MSPTQHKALARIVERGAMKVRGRRNTADVVAEATAEALYRRDLVQIVTQDVGVVWAVPTLAGDKLAAQSEPMQ